MNRRLLSPRPWQRIGVLSALLWALAWSAPVSSEPLPLPPELQKRVNQAIDRGVQVLRGAQGNAGTWALNKNHMTGYAALPGLTLLECGVPASDPTVQRAAAFVRWAAPKMDKTYELSLSILFLDRLGNPKDRALIETLAVRLIAGQTVTGGWHYSCPIVSTADHKKLINILRQLEPPKLFNPLDVRVAQLNPLGKGQEQPGLNPLAKGGQELGNPLPGGSSGSQNPLSGVGAPRASPTDPGVGLIAPRLELGADADAPREAVEHWSRRWNWCIKAQETPDSDVAKPPAKKAVTIPAHFASLPALHDPWRLPVVDLHNPNVAFSGRTDNSNTQFAILALWAARRHDVPMIRTLNLITKRYITSQNADGTWDYRYFFGGGLAQRHSDAMTCVGLLGLAVGHGLARDPVLNPVPDRQRVAQDPRIVQAFAALSRKIGAPTGQWENLPMKDLYFLWSVERVGVLYDLPTIDNKDWYQWGAEILVANQRPQGHWEGGGYHGASPVLDTCLALLFLKRANFSKDLTNVLPFSPRDLSERISQMNPVQKETPKEQSRSQSRPPKAEESSPPPSGREDLKLPAPPPVEKERATPRAVPSPSPSPSPPNTDAASEGGNSWLWFVLLLGMILVFGGVAMLLARKDEEHAEEVTKPRRKRVRV